MHKKLIESVWPDLHSSSHSADPCPNTPGLRRAGETALEAMALGSRGVIHQHEGSQSAPGSGCCHKGVMAARRLHPRTTKTPMPLDYRDPKLRLASGIWFHKSIWRLRSVETAQSTTHPAKCFQAAVDNNKIQRDRKPSIHVPLWFIRVHLYWQACRLAEVYHSIHRRRWIGRDLKQHLRDMRHQSI